MTKILSLPALILPAILALSAYYYTQAKAFALENDINAALAVAIESPIRPKARSHAPWTSLRPVYWVDLEAQ